VFFDFRSFFLRGVIKFINQSLHFTARFVAFITSRIYYKKNYPKDLKFFCY